MTDEQIDHLIGARNRLTELRDEQIDTRAVDHIDAVLRDIPPGQRNDVDLLLGRSCAQLPYRAAYDAELYRLMSEGQPDGIIEQYSSATEGHW